MPVKFPNLVDMPNSQTVSWDPPSRDWPVIIFSDDSVCDKAYGVVAHGRLVPYGEYVRCEVLRHVDVPDPKAAYNIRCDYELRISSIGYLVAVRALLSSVGITSKDILDIRKNGG